MSLRQFRFEIVRIEQLAVGAGLREGHQDPAITDVQQYLRRYQLLDSADRPQPGVLCPVTMLGIRRLQRSNGLEQRDLLDEETRSAMLQHRCGEGDYPTAFGGRTRWNALELTYTFGDIAQTAAQLIEPQVFRAAFRRAFDTWERAGVGLRFNEVRRNENPFFLVEWVRAADPDEGLVGRNIAHGAFPPDDGNLPAEPLNIHLDFEEHAWADGRVQGAYDIETVALHEIGHCLGLTHTEVRDAVMHKDSNTFLLKRELHDDDVAAIRSLYQPVGVQVAIRAGNGMFVCADGGGGAPMSELRTGRLIADRTAIREWERFTFIDLGTDVVARRLRGALQVHNGLYVSALDGGGREVVSNRPWIQGWETIWVVPLGNDRYAFQAYGDQFLRIGQGGVVRADGARADDPNAVFTVFRV